MNPYTFNLRDQATLAAAAAVALAALALYLWGRPGPGLIEIDRADPVEIEYLVDVNSADWPELVHLPGISETLARRIVASRETEGPFRSPEDLQRVRGIGPKTLDGLLPYLRALPPEHAVAGP